MTAPTETGARARARPRFAPPPLVLAGRAPALFAVGRLALPMFVLALAYNLARPGAAPRAGRPRAPRRMLGAGLLATPPFVALGGAWVGVWPLNVMFSLALFAGIAAGLARGGRHAARAGLLFLLGGALVDYFWVGALLGVAAWSYFRRPAWRSLALLGAAFAGLCRVNGNPWALAALPLAALVARSNPAL